MAVTLCRSPGVAALFVGAVVALAAGLRAADEMAPLTEKQKVVHVLNRLGYGPRPGDVERIEKMGLEAYIHQQLHPETIHDDAAEQAIARFDTLGMSSGHLLEAYFTDIRRFIEQQRESGDPEEMKLRYGINISKNPLAPATMPSTAPARTAMPFSVDELVQRDALRCIGELQDAQLIRATLSERQLNEVLADFWENHFNIDVKKNQCRALKIADDRDAIRPLALGHFRQLLGASAHSPAMLVYLDNNENAVARERGTVEKKLIEIYIRQKIGIDPKGVMSNREGLNENYGREILELHTLGVDGGYTQKDVQEVARCFTGWTLNPFNGKFQFTANRHDDGEKTVLGHTIPAGGGESDGEKVLDILASHPSTARFISRKLCQRFVCDDPPADLVDRIARVFHDTDGDLRRVVAAIFASPEFFAPSVYRAKIKSPLEYAVSAVRAAGGQFVEPANVKWEKLRHVAEGAGTIGYGAEKLSAARRKSLNWSVFEMGQPLFDCAPPTGYSEVSAKWVSPGALIDRLNFALALTGGEVSDVTVKPQTLLAGVDADQPKAALERLSQAILHGEMGDRTRETILKGLLPQGAEASTIDVPKLTALVLGSPEFQRR